ncbi:MAG: GerW family sporulation protein [Lachnospiraceae bacterium]|nr:GerW family sporulation protein [Lachnospiraceae bacterium]
MNNNNSFEKTVESLFKGMDSFITTKTVVGDAIHIGDTIILPLVDVSFGVGAGAFSGEKKNNGGGGMGGKITPSSILVMQNGTTKLINVKNQDAMTKVLDMVPDIINKFTAGKQETPVADAVEAEVKKQEANMAE